MSLFYSCENKLKAHSECHKKSAQKRTQFVTIDFSVIAIKLQLPNKSHEWRIKKKVKSLKITFLRNNRPILILFLLSFSFHTSTSLVVVFCKQPWGNQLNKFMCIFHLFLYTLHFIISHLKQACTFCVAFNWFSHFLLAQQYIWARKECLFNLKHPCDVLVMKKGAKSRKKSRLPVTTTTNEFLSHFLASSPFSFSYSHFFFAQ